MQEISNENDIQQAKALNHYVADHFIVAHIEGDHTNGREALRQVSIDTSSIYSYPRFFLFNSQGQYLADLSGSALEIRESGEREYRGYNRQLLLNALQKLNNNLNN